MLTFAFVVLSFILFSVAGYFIYRQVGQSFADQMRTHKRITRAKVKSQDASIAEFSKMLADANSRIDQLGTLNAAKLPTGFNVPNFRDKMEDRYVAEAKKFVVVDEAA